MSTYIVFERATLDADYVSGVFDNYNAAVASALRLSKNANSPNYVVCGYRPKENNVPGELSLVYAMEVSLGAIVEEHNYR